MNQLILECQSFLKDFGYTYAFCGGYALEMFTNEKKRTHSDIDITLFNKNRKNMIAYLLSKGWNVYESLHTSSSLRSITDPNDEGEINRLYIWAIKPGSSLIDIEPMPNEKNRYHYEILNREQTHFDFIDITFNDDKDGAFVCDGSKGIVRTLDKAILYQGDIPYLAPEIILFFIANPAYLESDYHREKNNMDWSNIPSFLPKESMIWLIKSLRIAYPEGNKRLDELIALNMRFK
jgi:hypothetical protein